MKTDSMLVQKIKGGLGNQMFQYAYIKARALAGERKFLLDLSEYSHYPRAYELELFDMPLPYASKKEIPWYECIHASFGYRLGKVGTYLRLILAKLNPYHHIESKITYDPKFAQLTTGYIEGYFQSEKYFIAAQDQIRKDFSFKYPLSPRSQDILTKIQSEESISIHIRRGDYLKNNNLSYHGICDMEYYKKAIGMLKKRTQNPTFFFFSDDMERVKTHFSVENAYYIDRNSGPESWQDMYLMSQCKHHIIANSSFSWWGARLNPNQDKMVIAPKQWFAKKDLDSSTLIPESWIRL